MQNTAKSTAVSFEVSQAQMKFFFVQGFAPAFTLSAKKPLFMGGLNFLKKVLTNCRKHGILMELTRESGELNRYGEMAELV